MGTGMAAGDVSRVTVAGSRLEKMMARRDMVEYSTFVMRCRRERSLSRREPFAPLNPVAGAEANGCCGCYGGGAASHVVDEAVTLYGASIPGVFIFHECRCM